jgi:isopentenyldiphosphate isomerase
LPDYPPIQIVDENDKPLRGASMEEAHAKGLIHRAVIIIVQDPDGNILLQKRGPNVATYPNVWDISAAGHVDEGEPYLAAAQREVSEELGLTDYELQEVDTIRIDTIYQERIMNRFARLYQTTIPHNTDFTLAKDELTAVKWCSPKELKDLIDNKSAELHPDLTITLGNHFLN